MQNPLVALLAWALLAWALLGLASAAAQTPLYTDYYPLKVGNQWTYRVTDLKSSDVKNDALTKEDEKKKRYPKVQIEVERQEVFERGPKNEKDSKGKEVAEKFMGFLLKSTSGGKTTLDHVVVMSEGIYRVNVGGTPNSPPLPITPPLLFFKLPLKAGDRWECDSKSGNTAIKGTFTAGSENLAIADKNYDTFLVSYRDGPAGNTRVEIDYWFARGLGMVKQRLKAKNHEVILELEEFVPAEKRLQK